MRGKNKRYNLLLVMGLSVVAVLFILPLVFTGLSSLKQNSEIFSQPFSLPTTYRFDNYQSAWRDANMSRYMWNSVVISVATVFIVLVISSMASYVLARFNFKFNKYLSLFFLTGMMVPMHTVLVPVAYIIGGFNLKNNMVALILLYVAFSIPFTTVVLTRFMAGISKSLEEAAVMDGASFWQIYSRIIMPMSVPALSTVSIFNFLGAWNDVLFPLLFISDDQLKPVSLGLLNFRGERSTDFGPLMAGIGITIILPLVVYIIFQEQVEKGVASGAVKE